MTLVWALLLVLVELVGWVLTVLGMPGNWVIVVAASVYAILVPADSPAGFGWTVPVVLLGLAALGEVVEFSAGALGTAKAGGSKRGAALALVGSLAGAMVGLVIGVPIPVIGPLLGAVLLAAAGAFLGAVLGEQWKGRSLDESYRVGQAAFWGRLLGTVLKTVVGAAMVGTTIVALMV